MPKGDAVALDFSDVRPFDPLDSSLLYLCSCSKFELGESKQKKPKVSLEGTIIAPIEVQAEATELDEEGNVSLTGELAIDKEGNPLMTKAENRKLFREFSLESQALPFLHEALKAMDPSIDLTPTDDKDNPLPFKFLPKKFVGMTFTAKIANEVYDEQVRPRLKKILPESAYKG